MTFLVCRARKRNAVDSLIDADSIAMTGFVLTEILQGCRSRKDFSHVKELLLALPRLETTQSVWIKAGEISGWNAFTTLPDELRGWDTRVCR